MHEGFQRTWALHGDSGVVVGLLMRAICGAKPAQKRVTLDLYSQQLRTTQETLCAPAQEQSHIVSHHTAMSNAGDRPVKRGRPRKDAVPEDDYFDRIQVGHKRYKYKCAMCPETRSSVANMRVHCRVCDPVQAAIHGQAHAGASEQPDQPPAAEDYMHDDGGAPAPELGANAGGDAMLQDLDQQDAPGAASQQGEPAASDVSEVDEDVGPPVDMDTSSGSECDDDAQGSVHGSVAYADDLAPAEVLDEPDVPEEFEAPQDPVVLEHAVPDAAVQRNWFPRPKLESTGAGPSCV